MIDRICTFVIHYHNHIRNTDICHCWHILPWPCVSNHCSVIATVCLHLPRKKLVVFHWNFTIYDMYKWQDTLSPKTRILFLSHYIVSSWNKLRLNAIEGGIGHSLMIYKRIYVDTEAVIYAIHGQLHIWLYEEYCTRLTSVPVRYSYS